MRVGIRAAKFAAVTGLVVGVIAVAAGPAGATSDRHGASHTLYVSNSSHGSGTWSDLGRRDRGGCKHAGFTTIGAAVSAANPGDTVVVCPGTYAEDVQVDKPLQLQGHATINATGLTNGIVITSSYVGVSGFTVTGALAEGILAEPPGTTSLPFPLTTASQALQPITTLASGTSWSTPTIRAATRRRTSAPR